MLCQPQGRSRGVHPKRPAGRSGQNPRDKPPKKKKRPTPEGAGLPGVVPFDIVNWEGNYILDTNTFLIVTSQP